MDRTNAADRRAGPAVFAWLWMAGAAFASGALVLLATLPPLPAARDEVTAWVEVGWSRLGWSGELLFVSVLAWGVGATGVLSGRIAAPPLRRALAQVGLGVALLSSVIMLLALGRLAYPVVAIPLSADSVVLVASVINGALHLALLALAVVSVALPVSARLKRTRRASTILAGATGALFVVGSFPWLLPGWLNLAVAVGVGSWGVLIGAAVLVDDRPLAWASRSRPIP